MCDSEKLIESAYHTELLKYYPMSTIRTACGTDGVLETELPYENHRYILKLIIETKLEECFAHVTARANVLGQAVYYLKKFELSGERIPNVVLVGDKDECFVVHSNYLLPYLDQDYNWKLAPSSVKSKNPELILALTEDEDLQGQCFVFVIDEYFRFDEVILKIEQLAIGIKTKVRITHQSLSRVFDYFTMRILKKDNNGKNKYTPREQVEFFMHLVTNQDDCYLHPKKKNLAIFANRKNIMVDGLALQSFLTYYQFEYNAKIKKDFTAICDRLIADSERRKKGDFYTPSIWVDEAHQMLSENLGSEWKDTYIVWNCAWGTGNLTRDYSFTELYCSTLEEHDLIIAEKYNKLSTKFIYDFLNDDVILFDKLLIQVANGYSLTEKDFKSSKLYKLAPQLIQSLLQGKQLLFFINPPYGTSAEMSSISTHKKSKNNISTTAMGSLVSREKIGGCSQQLYAQFIYRTILISKLFNIQLNLALFSPTLLMTGVQFKWFRDKGLHNMLLDGFFFQASEFADVKSNWSIAFTLWSKGGSNKPLKGKNIVDAQVYTLARKLLYSVDTKNKILNFLPNNRKDQVKTFTMSNAINPTNGHCLINKDSFCVLFMDTPRVEYNNQFVTLIPHRMKGNKIAIYVDKDNIYRITSVFAARRLITNQHATWMNWQDEYMIPNIQHPLYLQWNNDCMVYSLFNSKSHQSSLRNISYEGEIQNIFNHFFFMSYKDIENLALGVYNSKDTNDDIFEDIVQNGKKERFVYEQLQHLKLSNDAQLVLDKAIELTKSSFKHRNLFSMEHPEFHINTWDAGWYQIKAMLKEYDKDGLKEFNKLYTELEDRMRPLVHELGFLKS